MIEYPKYAEVDGERFEINTDFRIAIKCNDIAQDENINDFERALAILYLLFGEKGLNATDKMEKLFELAMKFLSCDKEIEDSNENKNPDMDFIQDMDYIEASFMSDFHIDLANTEMHWWKFMKLINGLSNSELGNCCVLNNIRNLRNFDVSQIKDDKERQKILKAKQQFALKKNEKKFTKEQEDAMDKFNKLAGL